MSELYTAAAMDAPGNRAVLTGAGVSAESGIPTFRGKEGYWTVGSREYHPQELATHAAFARMPWDVWAWYLYRRARVSRGRAERGPPRASARLRLRSVRDHPERRRPPPARRQPRRATYPIHGDIDHMRCAAECCLDAIRFDASPASKCDRSPKAQLRLPALRRDGAPARAVVRRVATTSRGSSSRPRAASPTQAWTLVVAGTSAQTNLPWQVVTLAARAAPR